MLHSAIYFSDTVPTRRSAPPGLAGSTRAPTARRKTSNVAAATPRAPITATPFFSPRLFNDFHSPDPKYGLVLPSPPFHQPANRVHLPRARAVVVGQSGPFHPAFAVQRHAATYAAQHRMTARPPFFLPSFQQLPPPRFTIRNPPTVDWEQPCPATPGLSRCALLDHPPAHGEKTTEQSHFGPPPVGRPLRPRHPLGRGSQPAWRAFDTAAHSGYTECWTGSVLYAPAH